MRADRVEVVWDDGKRKWAVRIQIGEEVIHRSFDASKDADEQTLRAAAGKALQDEGYDADAAAVTVRR